VISNFNALKQTEVSLDFNLLPDSHRGIILNINNDFRGTIEVEGNTVSDIIFSFYDDGYACDSILDYDST